MKSLLSFLVLIFSLNISAQANQDSLRNVILKSKTNKILKESFLQELYIRNAVDVKNNEIVGNIVFNLHGPDCGAPDCFSNDVSFKMKLTNPFKFPKTLEVSEQENGCVEKKNQYKDTFVLVEESKDFVLYHSAKLKKSLILFRNYKDFGSTAFYFTDVSKNQITEKNLKTLIENYNEDTPKSVYPFSSWSLDTSDYQTFLP
ncbi:hypothetical protein [Soonwooa sp.]|uniref:hypothetical protein n=1 Tax=Soonwooa sp. TaxID=1938592 RepID=UPI00262666EF|nr:hypothetical protein [Soonwooa sp.]